ncbi:phosphotransferase [Nocardia sp. NPDC050710]|uniref:phosphotransferase n=1 Tax=Nocardia sp. NPDC050710 TaxID=3157220 RepID=UPI0033FB03F0
MTGRVVHAPVALLGQPLAPLVEWATGELTARGIAVTGPAEEMRRRSWSLLARIPTEAGPMWAKANARGFIHEGPLLAALARLCPDSVLEPLAIQPDRGWLLSRDGGPTGADSDVVWTGLLRSYADLQRTLTAHIDELRDTGTPYLPPARLITVYRHYEDRIPGLGDHIAEAAAELADFGRLSLEHNDLRPGNVFAAADSKTGLLFDWGDAVITHPFLSTTVLHSPYRAEYFARWRRGGQVDDTEIALAERLAPLIALNPWRTTDTSPPRYARIVDELLDELRSAFR